MFKSKDLFKHLKFYSEYSSLNRLFECNYCSQSENDVHFKCWKCSKNVSLKKLFCDYCNSVQKPNTKQINYYDLFDLKLTYLVNKKELSKKFKYLQTQLHPDKFSKKDKEEQSISESYSSYLNKAYSTLQNPLERGLYLLSLENIVIDESSKDTDRKLLVDILLLNEQLDDTDTEQELDTLYAHITDVLEKLIEELNNHFERKRFEAAKQCLIRMKYYTTLQIKTKEKRNQLDLSKHSK